MGIITTRHTGTRTHTHRHRAGARTMSHVRVKYYKERLRAANSLIDKLKKKEKHTYEEMMRLKRLVEEQGVETVDDIIVKTRFWMDRAEFDFNDVFISYVSDSDDDDDDQEPERQEAEQEEADIMVLSERIAGRDIRPSFNTSEPCPICLEDDVTQPVSIIQCNHKFCRACIIRWFKNGNTACPVCRNDE